MCLQSSAGGNPSLRGLYPVSIGPSLRGTIRAAVCKHSPEVGMQLYATGNGEEIFKDVQCDNHKDAEGKVIIKNNWIKCTISL